MWFDSEVNSHFFPSDLPNQIFEFERFYTKTEKTNNGNITVVFGVHSCRKETIRTKLISNYVGFSFKSWFGRLKKSILIDLLA
ncbi:Uncharacterized protein XB17_00803 [Leptospira santarosai]|nr:Uncharacterized protein XB17_00803 [Leptospira santarosai]